MSSLASKFGTIHTTNLGPKDKFPTFVEDTAAKTLQYGALVSRRIATVSSVPALVETETYAPTERYVLPGGVNFVEVLFPAGSETHMHETSSIDFGVMTKGELVLVLEGGEERVVKTGDIFIQRATNHKWENRSEEDAIFAAVLVHSNMPQGKTSTL